MNRLMDETYNKLLANQGYFPCGEHTSLKICEWTRKSLRGDGVCYKQKFYGINSHRCVQMSPAMNLCCMDCIYCWRDRYESPFSTIDDPVEIIERCVQAQVQALIGFKGNDAVIKKKYLESTLPKHFAISLSGEPCAYPKLPELICELHERGITTFVVSNGMFPEMLARINPTQLYLSYDTPNEELFYKIDRPDLPDAWARLNKSLDVLREKRKTCRTVLRVTLVRGLNDNFHKEMAQVFEKTNPLAIEIKSYMYVGASRNKLTIKHMPTHEEVMEYSTQIEKHCGYRVVDEQKQSRVTLLMRPQDADRRMIDYSTSEKKFAKWTDEISKSR